MDASGGGDCFSSVVRCLSSLRRELPHGLGRPRQANNHVDPPVWLQINGIREQEITFSHQFICKQERFAVGVRVSCSLVFILGYRHTVEYVP